MNLKDTKRTVLGCIYESDCGIPASSCDMFGAFARAYILLSVKSAGAEIRSTIGSPHSGACALHSPALHAAREAEEERAGE